VGGQVEELKTSPNEHHDHDASAPELAARALDSELNAPGAAASASKQLPINDLTMVVKKKKKAPDTDVPEKQKRKADDEGSSSPAEKKARLQEAPQP
jgi:HAT1-interacting factor 1